MNHNQILKTQKMSKVSLVYKKLSKLNQLLINNHILIFVESMKGKTFLNSKFHKV